MHTLKQLDKAEKKEEFQKVANALEKHAVDTAAWAIVGWDNDKLMGGEFSPDYARKLMADPRFVWMRKGVNEFVQQDAVFFRQPPATIEGESGDGGEAR
jgi:hypothetical protein